MHYLVTGHTGFKGAWLTLLLLCRGHPVSGLALDLTLADALLAGCGAGQWNFGPGRDSFVEVGQVATLAAELWGGGAHWDLDDGNQPHEANLLALDSSKAQRDLGWRNRLGFRDALAWTIDSERQVHAGADALSATQEQIAAFESLQ